MAICKQLCVVVPIGPGDSSWRLLLTDLLALPASAEIMLSAVEPEPADFAALQSECKARLRWVVGSIGRVDQQNRAAMLTQHPWLWFLHADSRLPREILVELEHAHADALNYFKLRFYDGPMWMRVTEFGVALRCWLFKLPFGDQGFLLERACFERLGGFAKHPRSGSISSGGEDVLLVQVARLMQVKLVPLPAAIGTSARKYQHYGWLRTTLRHLRSTWRQSRTYVGQPHAR